MRTEFKWDLTSCPLPFLLCHFPAKPTHAEFSIRQYQRYAGFMWATIYRVAICDYVISAYISHLVRSNNNNGRYRQTLAGERADEYGREMEHYSVVVRI